MGYGVKLKVWGEAASFNRPETKVERVSYDVMTPSAARGILEAIYWKPEMRWVVDRIHVLAPIRHMLIRRNELDTKIPVRGETGAQAAMRLGYGNLGIEIELHRQQRSALILRDVCYGIEAHILVRPSPLTSGQAKPEGKHLDCFFRRARNGQYFHHPYLGCREFPASFELVDSFPPCPAELQGKLDLGLVLNDIVFEDNPQGEIVDRRTGRRMTARPHFFHAILYDGVLTVPPIEERGVWS